MWSATERVVIAAPPTVVWEIISDIRRHQMIQGSGEIKSIRIDGPLRVGSSWEADEVVKGPGSFTARSECTQLEPERVLAWRSFPPPISKRRPADSVPDVRWVYRLDASASGTVLEESFSVRPPKVGARRLRMFYRITRRERVIRQGMAGTLANVKAAAEAEARTNLIV